jgi:replicative DNA helicase
MSQDWTPTSLAEIEVLGAAMNDEESLAKMLGSLQTNDFSDSRTRMLFERIRERVSKNEPVDFAEMIAACHSRFPMECLERMQQSPRFEVDGKIRLIRSESTKRFARKSAQDLIKAIENGNVSAPSAIAGKLDALAKSTMERMDESDGQDLRDLVHSAINTAAAQSKDLILSGIEPVDELTAGFARGEYVTIAARTSVGKSAYALTHLIHTALSGKWSLYASTEMLGTDVMLRAIAQVSGVPISAMKSETGTYLDAEQSKRVVSAMVMLQNLPMEIRDNVRTIDEIEALVIRMKSQKKDIRLVVVDYIGQLRTERKINSRTDEIAEISRRLMQLATREGITVLSCAQLNRLSDPFGKPDLNQIRDSGAIEQDSSKVIMLSRTKNDPSQTRCHLLKNRSGQVGEVDIRFYGSNMRFIAK